MSEAKESRRWYSVYSAKTDELVAAGTAEMVTDSLGYPTINCFYSAINHAKKKQHNIKYRFVVDAIPLDEYKEVILEYRKQKGYKVTKRR